jgi:glutamate formiminotransferase / 5-formyltetrahydrofolate cyclo-ligase
MKKILLSEPNFSEGRDKSIIDQVIAPIRSHPGIRILHTSSDADHNRSVLTYLGEAQDVLEATQAMASKAIELIDMTQHHGSHPRMGAVDVVPFIPVRGIEIEEAVEIARCFGKFLGGLGVPVYYYEAAALRPERNELPAIRKGEYEALEKKLIDPPWKPDEGPTIFNPKSGATVTGVRFPLIAVNVNLRTTDKTIADRIARAVRNINGGFRYVRAMGLSLEEQGLVQVSMNLINYSKTPIHRVLETVRSEAFRYGVQIAGTEIVGPIPMGALEDVCKFYLQAHEFSLDQVVEMALID